MGKEGKNEGTADSTHLAALSRDHDWCSRPGCALSVLGM